MIFVDTSVWIDFFNGKDTAEVLILDSALGTEAVAIGDLIALEILQGFKSDKNYHAAKGMLDALTIYDMLGVNAAPACAVETAVAAGQRVHRRSSTETAPDESSVTSRWRSHSDRGSGWSERR